MLGIPRKCDLLGIAMKQLALSHIYLALGDDIQVYADISCREGSYNFAFYVRKHKRKENKMCNVFT